MLKGIAAWIIFCFDLFCFGFRSRVSLFQAGFQHEIFLSPYLEDAEIIDMSHYARENILLKEIMHIKPN